MKRIQLNRKLLLYSLLVSMFLGLFPLMISAQTLTINGAVTDAADNAPLPGVVVKLEGSQNGVITDLDGNYTIKVNSPKDVLVFSFMGYTTEKVVAGDQTKVNVRLKVSVSDLEEVVVVGYSTQKKKDLIGAVSVVDMKAVGNSSYSNVLQAVQGKISGVSITQDGQPGSGRTQMKVRGVTTMNNNTPLYVVDGIPTTESLDNLNPNDIESLQVLKDAASASIYGSRSAGGVVIITTKKGKVGKISIEAGVQTGIQTLANKIDLLNAPQWGDVYWTAAKNTGITPSQPSTYGSGASPVISTVPFVIPNQKQIYQYSANGTDWYKEVYHQAASKQYYANFSNASDKGSVFMGLSYFDQDGLIRDTYFKRFTGRVNSSYNLTDWIKVGENLSISNSKGVQIGTQQTQDGIPLDVIRQHPLLPVRDAFGAYAGKIPGLPDVRNMVSVLEKNKDNTNIGNRLFGNIYFEANILDAFPSLKKNHDLIFRSNYGVEYSEFDARQFDAQFHEGEYDIASNTLTTKHGRGTTTTFTNTLEYSYVEGVHNLKLLGGNETISYQSDFLNGSRTGFEIEDPTFTYLDAGSAGVTNSGGGTEWGLKSYFGRLDYTLAERYLISGTLRHDQTSRFNTSGTFPSLSFGWRLTEEPVVKSFLESTKISSILSDIKVRASYGEQGNQNTSNDFPTLSTMGSDNNHANYDILGKNTEVNQGYVMRTHGNSTLRWEVTKQTNIGADIALFNRQIEFTFEYYVKKTDDILRKLTQISALGEGDPYFSNAAKMKNTGIDFTLTHNYKNKEFSLTTQFQLNKYTNQITSLGDGANVAQIGNEGEQYMSTGDGTRSAVGKPYAQFYGYVVEGIFQNQADVAAHATQTGAGVGRIKYQDINNDKVIDDKDRTYIGNPLPKLTMGLNFNAQYKDITLAMSFYSSLGQKVYNNTKWFTDFAQCGDFNHGTSILGAWSPNNTGSSIPAPTLNNDNNENRSSSYYVEDGSFLKMRSIRLGYHIPNKFTKKANINIYGEIQNVFTLTKYSGIDPEVPYASDSNVIGVDNGVYPLPRIFMCGFTINL